MLRVAVIPIQLISIEEEGYHLLVHAKINSKAATLLIDTGASRSVFDLKKIKKFVPEHSFSPNEKLSTGLGTNSMETMTTLISLMQFGKLKIKDFQTVLLDLRHVNESYRKLGLEEIDGVVGNDLLVPHRAVINYPKKEMRLRW